MQDNLIDLSGFVESSNVIVVEIEKLHHNNVKELIYQMNKELNLMFDDITQLKMKKSKLDTMEANINKSIDNLQNVEYSDNNVKKELFEELDKVHSKIKVLIGTSCSIITKEIKDIHDCNTYLYVLLILLSVALVFLSVTNIMSLNCLTS